MSKDEKTTHPRMMSKEKRSKHEEDLKKKKILTISGIVVACLVVLVLIAGVLIEFVFTPNKVLAQVESEKITVRNFQEAVRYRRVNLISNYNYMTQLYRSFGMDMDPETKNNYESQLDPKFASFLGQQVYSAMVDQRVLEYGAKKLGIDVSDADVMEQAHELWGYFPNGTPTPKPTNVPPAATPTVSDAQLKALDYLPTPTPTATLGSLTSEEAGPAGEETPVATDAPVVEATVVSEETTVPTEEVSPTPTMEPTVYTEEMFQKNFNAQFEKNENYSEAFFKKELYYQLLEDKVNEYLAKDIATEQDMVWARHILVDTEEEAKAVIARLDQGENWNAVAAEVSKDTSNKDNGGDLGWFTKDRMVAPFADAAFAQEVGTYSKEPVKTDFGYHIIQVIGHEVRPLTTEQRDNEVKIAYSKWLNAEKEQLKVKIGTDWMKFVPTEPALNAF